MFEPTKNQDLSALDRLCMYFGYSFFYVCVIFTILQLIFQILS